MLSEQGLVQPTLVNQNKNTHILLIAKFLQWTRKGEHEQ